MSFVIESHNFLVSKWNTHTHHTETDHGLVWAVSNTTTISDKLNKPNVTMRHTRKEAREGPRGVCVCVWVSE